MPNQRLASRYAKSLIDLAIDKGQLEAVYADMLYLKAVCKSSREFLLLLRSPIIKGDQKNSIITAVTKGKVSDLTAAFNHLLVKKGRESDLPEIGQIGKGAVEGIARQPEAANDIRANMIVAAAFVEAVALFAVVVALLGNG